MHGDIYFIIYFIIDFPFFRIDNSNDEKRMEVVEIPLKDSATCMAVHTESGQLALGLAKTILIYGICHKVYIGIIILYLNLPQTKLFFYLKVHTCRFQQLTYVFNLLNIFLKVLIC